jgi:type II secretory pathway component PulK
MKRPLRAPRRGATLIAVLVVLSVVSITAVAVGWQLVANRRHDSVRRNQMQAVWLAQSGVELAIDRLLSDPAKYRGETVDLLSQGQVRIKIEREPGPVQLFTIVSEARYPMEAPTPVARSITRLVRRKVEDGKARIEVVP